MENIKGGVRSNLNHFLTNNTDKNQQGKEIQQDSQKEKKKEKKEEKEKEGVGG